MNTSNLKHGTEVPSNSSPTDALIAMALQEAQKERENYLKSVYADAIPYTEEQLDGMRDRAVQVALPSNVAGEALSDASIAELGYAPSDAPINLQSSGNSDIDALKPYRLPTSLDSSIANIMSFEGFNPKPYKDTEGYSIGYGRNFKVDDPSLINNGKPVSKTEAAKDVIKYVVGKRNANKDLYDSTPEQLHLILDDWFYNAGNVPNSARQLIANKDYKGFLQKYLDTATIKDETYPGGHRPYPPLIERRNRNIAKVLGGM